MSNLFSTSSQAGSPGYESRCCEGQRRHPSSHRDRRITSKGSRHRSSALANEDRIRCRRDLRRREGAELVGCHSPRCNVRLTHSTSCELAACDSSFSNLSCRDSQCRELIGPYRTVRKLRLLYS